METFCDILKAIGAGAEKPTHIMYKANLSWTVMQSYIRSLEAQGLVIPTVEDDKKTYHLSDKGFQTSESVRLHQGRFELTERVLIAFREFFSLP